MTITDYVIDLALIGVVVLQVRGRRLTARSLLVPVALVAWAASNYLRSIPTSGNDLILIVACLAAGVSLGAGAGLLTRISPDADGGLFAKAGLTAGVLWLLGVGFRFAFQLYATHGGARSIGTFSVHHALTERGWVAALVLMAIGEALARTAIVAFRAYGPSLLPTARPVMMGTGEHLF